MKNKKALILGGLGFIGRAVAKSFIDNQVLIYDRSSEPVAGIACVQGALSEVEKLKGLVNKYDDIFHLAYSGVPSSVTGQEETVEQTLRQLCELCISSNCRLIFPSSGGTVYGEAQKIPISEDHPLIPISAYGISKLRQEQIIQEYGRKGLRYVILRIANCYGPGANVKKPQGIVSIAINNFLKGLPTELIGEGNQVRDYVYIDDVAEAFKCVFLSEVDASIINIGTGIGVSVIDVIRKVEVVTNFQATIHYKPEREFDVKVNILDSTLAKRLIGWQPKVPLDEGILKTYAAMRSE